MSVAVTIRLKVDPAKLAEVFRSRKADFEAVAAEARSKGAQHHFFAAGTDEVIVFDEWESAAQFQEFFENQPIIPKLIAEAGAAGPPEVSICEIMDSPDRF